VSVHEPQMLEYLAERAIPQAVRENRTPTAPRALRLPLPARVQDDPDVLHPVANRNFTMCLCTRPHNSVPVRLEEFVAAIFGYKNP
jgi:hypothetical protein